MLTGPAYHAPVWQDWVCVLVWAAVQSWHTVDRSKATPPVSLLLLSTLPNNRSVAYPQHSPCATAACFCCAVCEAQIGMQAVNATFNCTQSAVSAQCTAVCDAGFWPGEAGAPNITCGVQGWEAPVGECIAGALTVDYLGKLKQDPRGKRVDCHTIISSMPSVVRRDRQSACCNTEQAAFVVWLGAV
jgi:hypothetical protein